MQTWFLGAGEFNQMLLFCSIQEKKTKLTLNIVAI